MKILLAVLLTGCLAVSPISAFATDAPQERVEHYAAAAPANATQALELVRVKVADIATLLTRETLTGKDLEAIHEISYALEAAVDTLRSRQNATQKTALDALDEAVQAIHYASEEHDETKTRQWFAALRPAATQVFDVF